MVADMLAALVSTVMLTIGDIYGIPYLYLPWLINTIKGIALREGPALFELAYNVLPNASIPAGLFIFITLLLYGKNTCNLDLKNVIIDMAQNYLIKFFSSNSYYNSYYNNNIYNVENFF